MSAIGTVVSARCLKSKWPGSVPASGWNPFRFVVGRRKRVRQNKTVGAVSNCHSGQEKVFEV